VVEEVQVGLDFERSSAAGAAARVLTSCYLFAMSRSGDELFLDRKFYQYLQDHLHQVIVLVPNGEMVVPRTAAFCCIARACGRAAVQKSTVVRWKRKD
jgi:hypothetical protein